MKKLLLLLLVLPVAFAQQSCDPKQCSAQSRFTSEPFCSNDDVYSLYLEYYCSGNECVYRTTNRLIEDCQLGCSVGTCIRCNQAECEAKSGFHSNSYCSGNNVYRHYRQYSCEPNKGCDYTETQRLNQSCDADVTCSQGKCGLCDPVECNAKSAFYDDDFCMADSNVYRHYRAYRCSGDKCTFSQQEIKIADCKYYCDDGKCALPRCEPGCDSKDALFGQPYCRGNSVYRTFRDYFCGNIKCEFNDTEKKLEDCSKCSDGKCVVTKSRNERLFDFDVSFSNDTIERNITLPPARIFNGFLFGSNDLRIDTNAFVKSISFQILNTNKLGELSVLADSEKIFSTSKAGFYNVSVNRNVKMLTFSSSSSGLIFWMPAVYDLGHVNAGVIEDKTSKNEFAFALRKSELSNLKSAEIAAWPASTRIILNGKVLESNIIDKGYLQLQNKIEFLSLLNETFSRTIQLKIVYEG